MNECILFPPVFYQDNYAIKDKQDLLAMCLIEYASKFESVNNEKVVDDATQEESKNMWINILNINRFSDNFTRGYCSSCH